MAKQGTGSSVRTQCWPGRVDTRQRSQGTGGPSSEATAATRESRYGLMLAKTARSGLHLVSRMSCW